MLHLYGSHRVGLFSCNLHTRCSGANKRKIGEEKIEKVKIARENNGTWPNICEKNGLLFSFIPEFNFICIGLYNSVWFLFICFILSCYWFIVVRFCFFCVVFAIRSAPDSIAWNLCNGVFESKYIRGTI